MERYNNTYRDLINNKFSELLTADMNATWPGMREMLDREMPEKRKRKWLLWFTSRFGIFATVLLSLFASATGVYISFKPPKQENNDAAPPAKEIKKSSQSERGAKKSGGSEITSPYLHTAIEKNVQLKHTKRPETPVAHKRKQYKIPVTARVQNKAPETIKDTAKTPAIVCLPVKDSINVSSVETAQNQVMERRAF